MQHQLVFKTNRQFCFFILSFLVFINVSAQDLTLPAPDGSTVAIYRDSFGVPHIVADTELGVFFGQGFAVAQDRLYQMEQFRRAGEGRLAEALGPSYLNFDKEIRTMYYTKSERMELFNSLRADIQTMIRAYCDGVNTYLDSMAVNPTKYKPAQFMFLPFQPWTISNTIAIMQFMIRNFGAFGGEELIRLQELRAYGQTWFDLHCPINDPAAPTTIPSGGQVTHHNWTYSGMIVSENIIQAVTEQRENFRQQLKQLGLPLSFGSFAVLVTPSKSSSGNVLLLGCPQMGEPVEDEPQINNEVELICPSFHVGGMTVTGLPSVIIGHNEYHAWTLTSGISDNCDVYIDSTRDDSYCSYYFNGEWKKFIEIQDTIKCLGQSDIFFKHYRTVHGPVFGDDLAKHQVYAMKMTFWKREMDMIQFVLGLIRATNRDEFEAAAAKNPMSFNLFYAGKDQTVKYWHVGWYQDRTDGVDPRLPHQGDGSEEWGGLIDFEELPQAENPAQGYFVNWNNKPVSWWNNGDNIPWQGAHRVSAIDNYVKPISQFSYDHLKAVPQNIDSHGTYQQAIELSLTEIVDENILPPGQSGFIGLFGVRSPHLKDQWPLHLNWLFKDMIFGQIPPTTISSLMDQKTREFSLNQNFPNPFNPATTISYQLPVAGQVELSIFDSNGKLVQTLVRQFQPAGFYRVEWKADNMSSGIYFYRVVAGENSWCKKCMVIK